MFKRKKWICQQDSSPTHKARTTMTWLQRNLPHFITVEEWTIRSIDLNPLDYSLWTQIKSTICVKPAKSSGKRSKCFLSTLFVNQSSTGRSAFVSLSLPQMAIFNKLYIFCFFLGKLSENTVCLKCSGTNFFLKYEGSGRSSRLMSSQPTILVSLRWRERKVFKPVIEVSILKAVVTIF